MSTLLQRSVDVPCAVALCVLVAVASGCTTFSSLDRGVHDLGVYTIQTPIDWNKRGGRPSVWTVHGEGLDYLLHFNGVTNGTKIFARMRRDIGRPFVSSMRPTEVVDLFIEGVSIMRGTKAVRLAQLRPASFGIWSGFAFELEFESLGGLPMRGIGTGAIVEDELHLFFYAGAREHYFDRHLSDVKEIFASISG